MYVSEFIKKSGHEWVNKLYLPEKNRWHLQTVKMTCSLLRLNIYRFRVVVVQGEYFQMISDFRLLLETIYKSRQAELNNLDETFPEPFICDEDMTTVLEFSAPDRNVNIFCIVYLWYSRSLLQFQVQLLPIENVC